MKIIKLIIIFLCIPVLLFAQEEDFPLAGVKLRSFLESRPQLSNYNLTGNEKMESTQFSAFVNMAYPISKRALVLHLFKWRQSSYSIDFPDGNQKDVPMWMQTMPSLTSIDFTTGIQHRLSKSASSKKKWELWTYATASLTYGSGQIEIENQFNYTGIVQLARKWKNGSKLALGGFYYHGLDGDVSLPVLSVTLRKAKWGLDGMLPLDLVIFYELNPELKLTLSSELNFNSFRYQKQQASPAGFPTAKSAQLIQATIGPTLDWLFTKNWELSLSLGLFSQEFSIQTATAGEEVLRFSDSIYAGLGLSYVIR